MQKNILLWVLVFSLAHTPFAYGQKTLKPVFKSLGKVAAQKAPQTAAKALLPASPAAAAALAKTTAPHQNLPALPLPPLPLTTQETARQLQKQVDFALVIALAKQQEQTRRKMAAFDTQLRQRVGTLRNPFLQDFIPLEGTAFFIEEEYQGKKYLWGVTAAHMVDYVGPDIHLRLSLDVGLSYDIPVTVVAKGNTGMADIAIFKINEDVSDLVLPFTLAKREPKPNEVLRSYGFFEGDFHVVPNRKVLQSTPGRIVTSFEFGNHERAGACGGPLINEQNELVGIHCGSSRSKQESYAVPISFLKDLLEAAHHNGIKERDLVLNGRTIGKINIDEYIYSVSVKKLGITLRTVTPWREESRVDYNHLENLIELPHSGVLEIAIVKGGTIQTGQTKATSQKLISVNLRTGSSFLEYM